MLFRSVSQSRYLCYSSNLLLASRSIRLLPIFIMPIVPIIVTVTLTLTLIFVIILAIFYSGVAASFFRNLAFFFIFLALVSPFSYGRLTSHHSKQWLISKYSE